MPMALPQTDWGPIVLWKRIQVQAASPIHPRPLPHVDMKGGQYKQEPYSPLPHHHPRPMWNINAVVTVCQLGHRQTQPLKRKQSYTPRTKKRVRERGEREDIHFDKLLKFIITKVLLLLFLLLFQRTFSPKGSQPPLFRSLAP